ncbi:MAG TPA: cation:proton antiporter, partial [Treponemataceae bacterium]|nr:cation:proton antiporter [Treponemataceae bacterium]
SYDFSIAALGIGLLLAGVFEKQGLAMIIGAYVTGLSISKTDIAAVIQERIHGLYEFFVPLFFCVMGMMVNVGEMLNMQVLVIGLIYTLVAVLAKVLGCGIPALSLGFNIKGAVRIGVGMVPRGEVALIIAGIGLSAGILNQQMFGITVLMTLITTVLAAPLLNAALNIKGRGTRKEAKADTNVSLKWDFKNDEIADLVVDSLLKNLKDEGFYVQMMNIDDGISQARKNDIALSIIETESLVAIETSAEDAAFVKTSVYEVLLKLTESIENLTSGFDPVALKKEMAGASARMDPSLAKMLDKNTISINLEATTKDEILKELVLLATNSGHVIDWQLALKDVIAREKSMSTGMQKGIALPHAKTDGVIAPCIAIGIKKEGIDF